MKLTDSPVQTKVEELLSEMTLAEKIGQMFQTDPGTVLRSYHSKIEVSTPVTGPISERTLSKELISNLGSILSATDAQTAYEVQKVFLQHNRLKIPLLFMFDIIHGFRTVFPIPLGLASSWEPKLAEETSRVAAAEGAASGINVTFAPMADLVRDPRWGRVMESPGEDPYLNGQMAAAMVRGFQGDDLKALDTIAACVKHFAAYGAAEGGRDYNTVDMSEATLRNYYLPAYKAGIDAGAELIMTSFNVYDGVPATTNSFLLRNVLREEWGFEGVVISDYTSLWETIFHMSSKDGEDAAKQGLEAGLDIEMISTEYISHLEQLVERGEVDVALIDEAVRRILTLKFKLGLFDDPYRYINIEREKEAHLKHEYRQLARKAAQKSMVLLKNDGILPLKKDVKSVAVIGPFADSGRILGGWSGLGKPEEAVTVKQGLINKLENDVKITAAAGCDYSSNDVSGFQAALEAAASSEVVILAMGEEDHMSGEAGSRAYLTLPGVQPKLVEEVLKLGKPTVLVLFNGRPLELKWYHEHVPAILEAWFPGTEGGNAIADLLFGDANPSAKLTMSFPYTVGQVPVYYNCLNTGRPKGHEDNDFRFLSKYLDIPNAPFYPFGYGLSYTEFTYSDTALIGDTLTPGGSVKAMVTVQNTGNYAGEEIVQMYVRDLWGSTSRPLLELKGFHKIHLAPGEKATVEFVIEPEMLSYFTAKKQYEVEEGDFKVFVGKNARDLIECGTFTYTI
ncbi:glycoside hydrolase family 3 N-terminal domain-containing protein [Paenibacillus ihbetae]|uniref:beta-glucosidase n=1 Tax=Paenibacillus ihbetae TaxID=1870820 RepID=A0ABX3K2H0_9BACL|nr:glycoside hydrolase family 3 N-terminal domain-containing protein [Paenibacillus ihbetae]OOC63649.1 beta-glucosidase [Paenibacillus ihbetae]